MNKKSKFKFKLEGHAAKLSDALSKTYKKNHPVTTDAEFFVVEVEKGSEFAQGFITALRSVGCEV